MTTEGGAFKKKKGNQAFRRIQTPEKEKEQNKEKPKKKTETQIHAKP
jgi:hypothetical protein